MLWEKVMFQAECDPEGDGWCRVRDCDPSECPCVGPSQENYEYRDVDGVLFGRPDAVTRLRMALERILPWAGVTPYQENQRAKLVRDVQFCLLVLEDLDGQEKNPVPDLG